MRILGVDPGLRHTGWGLVERRSGGRLSHVESGVINSPTGELAERLAMLFAEMEAVIAEHRPDVAAIEKTFVNRDPAGALKLGHARGASLIAAAKAGLPVFEYAPNAVKKTVVGVGHADKGQVGHMVRLLLPGADPKSEDAADALAVAICHAQHAGAQTMKVIA